MKRLLFPCLALGLSPALWAQTANPATEPTAAPPAVESPARPAPVTPTRGPAPATVADASTDEEVIMLSPFIVQAEQDNGYQATNTLAGTRINTDIKDVGAAVSVYTEAFLQDIDARKIENVLINTASTEGGGASGNFAGFSGPNPDDARADPSGVVRVRSLSEATRTRDYFASDIPSDAYNFTTVTLSRGPNAILAGLGGAGGIVDVDLRKAGFTNSRSFSLRFGEYGSHRQELHANQVLIPKVLSIRLDAMNEHNGYRQDPAYEDDRRFYLATTWRIAPPKSSGLFSGTTLRANYENGAIEGVPPNPVPPVYSVQSWFPGTDPRDNLPWATPYWYHNGATRQLFNQAGVLQTNTNDMIRGFPIYRQWGLVFADPTSNTADVNLSIPGYEGVQGFVGTVLATTGHPGGSILGTGDQNRARTGYDRTLLVNRDVFDFYENLLTGSLDYREQEFDAFDLRLEQLFFGGRAGIELAYNLQNFESYRNFPISGGDAEIFIDINRYLSVRNDNYVPGTSGNGSPIAGASNANQYIENPNWGRPFIVSRDAFRDQSNATKRESYAATAFLRHSFTRSDSSLLRALGSHTVSGLIFRTDIERENRTYLSTWDPASQLSPLNHLAGQPGTFATQVQALYYIGGPQFNAATPDDVRLTAISSARPQFGQTYTLRSYDPTTRRFVTGTATPLRVLGTARDQLEEVQSWAVSWQGNWLNDSIVTILGYRDDGADAFTTIDPVRLPSGDLDLSNFQLVPAVSQGRQTWTKSIVLNLPKPLAAQLPFNSTFRLYGNTSGNFNPVGQRRNQYNEELGSPSAETREYGLGLTMFKGKFDLRINWFKTEIEGATVPGVGNAYSYVSGLITRMLQARDAGLVPSEFNYIHPALQDFEDVALAYYESIPQRMRDNIGEEFNFNPRFITTNGLLAWEPDTIVNKSSISDSIARGIEFEATLNASRSFRISVSVAKNEAIRANVAADELQWADEWYANLQTLYDGTLLRGSRAPASETQGTINTIWPQYTSEHLGPIRTQAALSGTVSPEIRKWRANMVMRYEIRNGWAKGASAGLTTRWQDEIAIGYPLVRDANNLLVSDINNPYFGDETLEMDLNLGYTRQFRLFGRRVTWRISSYIGNFIAQDDLIPVRANADGSYGVVRIPPARTWSITNSFSF